MSLIPNEKSTTTAAKFLSIMDEENLTIEEAYHVSEIIGGRVTHAIIKARDTVIFTSTALLEDS